MCTQGFNMESEEGYFLSLVLSNGLKCCDGSFCWKYLHPLLTATEHSGVCEFQGFFGSCTFLPFVLQTAEVPLIDGKRLKSLLWSQVTLENRGKKRIQILLNRILQIFQSRKHLIVLLTSVEIEHKVNYG